MSSPVQPEVTGSCLCGRIEYAFWGPVLDFRYCHCERCRKATGSAFAANIVVLKEQLRWISGENDVALFIHREADDYPRGFCRHCGGIVPRLARDGKRMVIPAGTLDSDPPVRPTKNIFWRIRARWFTAPGDLPTFDGYPES